MSYLRTLASRWKHPALGSIAVRTNSKLTVSVARWNASTGVIELAPGVSRQAARFRREVLCHEAAHAVVWARHGRKARSHGSEWQALVKQAGFEPQASLVRCGHSAQVPAWSSLEPESPALLA